MVYVWQPGTVVPPALESYMGVWRNQHILVGMSKEYELLWWPACIAFFSVRKRWACHARRPLCDIFLV